MERCVSLELTGIPIIGAPSKPPCKIIVYFAKRLLFGGMDSVFFQNVAFGRHGFFIKMLLFRVTDFVVFVKMLLPGVVDFLLLVFVKMSLLGFMDFLF